MKTCQLQDICKVYNSGDNKPPNHHVRLTVPCKKFLACDCEMYLLWMSWQRMPPSCKVKKGG